MHLRGKKGVHVPTIAPPRWIDTLARTGLPVVLPPADPLQRHKDVVQIGRGTARKASATGAFKTRDLTFRHAGEEIIEEHSAGDVLRI